MMFLSDTRRTAAGGNAGAIDPIEVWLTELDSQLVRGYGQPRNEKAPSLELPIME
jgi:hypothetical protein